jgi:hypothetical protein
MSLYFVFLRQPHSPLDKRSDPFWEFGSFGRTGCHASNLLHPANSLLEKGDRLAFLQGGHGEIKVVGLTPPIEIRVKSGRLEAIWNSDYRPISYLDAPLLINNKAESEFPLVLGFLKGTRRTTLCGAAGSRLRARKLPVEDALADQIVNWFSSLGRSKIGTYLDAIAGPNTQWHKIGTKSGWAIEENRVIEFERRPIISGDKYPKMRSSCRRIC